VVPVIGDLKTLEGGAPHLPLEASTTSDGTDGESGPFPDQLKVPNGLQQASAADPHARFQSFGSENYAVLMACFNHPATAANGGETNPGLL